MNKENEIQNLKKALKNIEKIADKIWSNTLYKEWKSKLAKEIFDVAERALKENEILNGNNQERVDIEKIDFKELAEKRAKEISKTIDELTFKKLPTKTIIGLIELGISELKSRSL